MRDVFGIRKLRDGQEEVIRSVMEGRNTLAIMPTGAGKSLCYQLPALHLPGTTVIVSPLISLMKDQVDKLDEAGLDASQVNSSLTERERSAAIESIEGERSEFLFTTPERLADPLFQETLRGHRIDFIVIDEAHCISEWGHDFRPSYLALSAAIKSLGGPPVLALTATATPDVVADIEKQLGVGQLHVVNTGIYRSNLRYEVIRATSEGEKRQHVLRLLEEIEGTGIVYAATVKAVEELTDFLRRPEFEIAPYHGKLGARERRENQERFMRGELKAVIATNAFGMGIDKSDIGFVIHYNMPGSLEAYYQESGRAGRDGEEARCILLYQLDDRRTQLFFLAGRYPKLYDVLAVYSALEQLAASEQAVSLAEVEESAAEVAKTKVRVILSLLKEMKVLRELRGSRFKLLRGDLSAKEIERLAQECEEKSRKDHAKLERMMLYGQSAACRWKLLREYFGEEDELEPCGNCDNCLHPIADQIALPRAEPLPSKASAAAAEDEQSLIKPGEVVRIPKVGRGRVKAVEGDKILVHFPDGETKKFIRDVVRKEE